MKSAPPNQHKQTCMKRVFTHALIPKKSVGFLPQLGGICLVLFASFLVLSTVKDECGQRLLEAVGHGNIQFQCVTTDCI